MAMLKGEIQLNGVSVFNTDGIKKHFNPNEIIEYYKSGRLLFVCSNDAEIKTKIESIDSSISQELIIKELATIFDALFDLESYAAEKKRKEEELAKILAEKLRDKQEVEVQNKLHEEIKKLDKELKKYLDDYLKNPNVGSIFSVYQTVYSINSFYGRTQIQEKLFKSKSDTEIKRILFDKISRKETLSKNEIILLKSLFYGSK